jgi:regulator of sirC expression with transglutaminase-like and TPR domain
MLELKHAIKQHNLFKSALLVSRQYQDEIDVVQSMIEMESLINQCAQHLESHRKRETMQDKLAAFIKLRDFFYQNLAFSGDHKNYFAARYNLLDQVIQYRTGIPITLAIVFCQIANAVGLKTQGVNFPGHFLMRFEVSDSKVHFIDPLDGKFLDWSQLQNMYFSVLGEEADKEMPLEVLEPVDCEETVLRLLHNLKASFINEQRYQNALTTIELLLDLCPDDPYEIRDRGFLLHQLDCPEVAAADYEYFVKQCPKDPTTEILRAQINRLREKNATHH